MGNPSPVREGGYLAEVIESLRRRVSELERPTGTSVGSLVAQVQSALANITSTVTAAIQSLSYTKSEIDSRIAAPGNVSASGSISAAGAVSSNSGLATPGTLTATAGINSTGAYGKVLTYGGPYRAAYWHSDGSAGYVPSSRRFKRGIRGEEIDPRVVLALRLVSFHYVEAEHNPDYAVAREWGLIAEDVHGLGLTWLVDYDEKGRPFGLKYERLALALLPALTHFDNRIATLERRLAAVEGSA